jgi:hypothetical protein
MTQESDKEIIIPEYQMVKREIIFDFFDLKNLIRDILLKPSPRRITEARIRLFLVYVMIREKIPESKEVKSWCKLKPIEESIIGNKSYNPPLAELVRHFCYLQEILDQMDLTSIKFSRTDPNFAL